MDAKLQKIQITPVKLDSEGDVKTPETAVIALEVPINTKSQKDAIIALMGSALGNEWVQVEITPKQLRFDFKADDAIKADDAEGVRTQDSAMELTAEGPIG